MRFKHVLSLALVGLFAAQPALAKVSEVRISQQFGLAYLPRIVAKEQAPQGDFDLARWPSVLALKGRFEALPGWKTQAELAPSHDRD